MRPLPEQPARAGRNPQTCLGAWRWFALSAAIVAADQLTKWLVLGYFENRYPRVELTDFFNLVLVFNKGAAFSLFAQAAGWQTPLLAAFALAAAVIVSVLIVRNPGRGLLCLGLALILGGAARQPDRPRALRPRGRFPGFPRARLALAGVQRRRLGDQRRRGDPDPRGIRPP